MQQKQQVFLDFLLFKVYPFDARMFTLSGFLGTVPWVDIHEWMSSKGESFILFGHVKSWVEFSVTFFSTGHVRLFGCTNLIHLMVSLSGTLLLRGKFFSWFVLPRKIYDKFLCPWTFVHLIGYEKFSVYSLQINSFIPKWNVLNFVSYLIVKWTDYFMHG